MSVWIVIAVALLTLVGIRHAARWLYEAVWLGKHSADPEALVLVGQPATKLEADIMADALRSAGIRVFVRELRTATAVYYAMAGDTYFGNWEVRVREADYERAARLLNRQ